MSKILNFFENFTFLGWALLRRHRCRDCIHFYQMTGRSYGFCDAAGEDKLLLVGRWPRVRADRLPCFSWAPFFPPKTARPCGGTPHTREAGEGAP